MANNLENLPLEKQDQCLELAAQVRAYSILYRDNPNILHPGDSDYYNELKKYTKKDVCSTNL